MTFDEILEQAIEMLQRRGRVSYRALKIQFDLSDDHLEALKEEIIEVHQVAVDQGHHYPAGRPIGGLPQQPDASVAQGAAVGHVARRWIGTA